MQVVVDREGQWARMRLIGRFDLTAHLTFRNATRPLLAEAGLEGIEIDFQKVPYIDSTALGLLLLLRELAQQAGKALVLKNCGPELTRVLTASQFHRLFRIE